MPIEAEFAEMMLDTILVAAKAGYEGGTDLYGRHAYAADVPYRCRLVYEQRILRDKDGQEVVEQGRALIYGVATASVLDRVTLPDGSKPLVTSVDTVADPDGDHHSVIGFGV